jgi:hypothetical protein
MVSDPIYHRCAVCVGLGQIAGDQIGIGLGRWDEAEGNFLAGQVGQALLTGEGGVVGGALIGIGRGRVLVTVNRRPNR